MAFWCLLSFLAGVVFAIWVNYEAETRAARDGVITIANKPYRLTEMK